MTYIKYSINLFIFLAVACSTPVKQKTVEQELESSLKLIGGKSINYGPSVSTSEIYKDVTKELGLSDLLANNFNIVDLNFDGYPDIVIIPEYYSQPIFLVYRPKLSKFERIASTLNQKIKATFLVFNDFNKDGVIDVLVGVLNQKTELEEDPLKIYFGYRIRDTLMFKDDGLSITKKSSPSSGVSLIDYDLDGDLDIFVSNWFGRYKNKPIAIKDLFIENVKGKYVDKTDKLSGELDKNLSKKMFINAAPTTGAQICDIDQNGYPDILTASSNGFPNALWMNMFKFRKDFRYFKNFGLISRYSGDSEGRLTQTGGGRTFSVACSDYNNDGIMDIFMGELTHSYDDDTKDKSSVLTGSKKSFPPLFIRTEYVLDSNDVNTTQADKRATWFDYDNDGLVDLLVDNSGYPPDSRLLLFKQYPDHSFENISKRAGIDIVNPQSTVVLDFNKDGRQDILTARSSIRDAKIQRRIFLFENKTINKNRALRIKLKGSKSNPQGLGATIIIKVRNIEGKLVLRRQAVSFSYGQTPAQNEAVTHFGINEGESLIFVKVRWPYSKNLNATSAQLEKAYEVNLPTTGTKEITLCENPKKC